VVVFAATGQLLQARHGGAEALVVLGIAVAEFGQQASFADLRANERRAGDEKLKVGKILGAHGRVTSW